jgi:hypothetical protein
LDRAGRVRKRFDSIDGNPHFVRPRLCLQNLIPSSSAAAARHPSLLLLALQIISATKMAILLDFLYVTIIIEYNPTHVLSRQREKHRPVLRASSKDKLTFFLPVVPDWWREVLGRKKKKIYFIELYVKEIVFLFFFKEITETKRTVRPRLPFFFFLFRWRPSVGLLVIIILVQLIEKEISTVSGSFRALKKKVAIPFYGFFFVIFFFPIKCWTQEKKK